MIAKYSVKKAYTVIVGMILILILGAVAYTKMTIDLLPDMEMPYAIIMTTYPGASPENVETEVTKPIEKSLATINNIKQMQSISYENYSMVLLEFNTDTNMDTATIDMRENLDQVSGFFNENVGTPLIIKMNPNMMPVMVFAIDQEGVDNVTLSEYVNHSLLPEMEGLKGVASVGVMGSVEESVQVILREEKIKKINQKVIKALDDKFAEAENALQDGKNKIHSGKSQLKKGQETASEQFAKGELQINSAKYELLKTKEDVTASYDELVKQEKALATQKTQLEQGIKSLQDLLTSYQNLETQKKQLETLLEQDPMNQEVIVKMQTVVTTMQVMEQKLLEQKDAQGNALTFTTLPQYITSLQTSLTTLNSGLTEIATGKKKLNKAMKKITKGNQGIDESYVELKKKEEETKSKLSTSELELQQGEKELDKEISNFEEAKESAYDGANLENIITREMVEGLLMAQNFEYPAGYIVEDDVKYLVRVGEKFKNVEDFSDFVLLDLGLEGLEAITLSDVADVLVDTNEDKIYSKVNGNEAIVLSVAKQNEYATKEVADRVVKKLESIKKENKDISVTTLMNQGSYIDMVSNSVVQNLIFGAILAILILLYFLKDIRPTGIIAVSIPISLVFAIVMMYFSGVTLNVISLSGLALGVGMLVDNSIVVIENIYRLRNEGYSVVEASIKGANQVVGAITSSTLTTVCVFLPIVFTTGITKQMFTDMGLTITYSLLASLIIAISFVPMVASKSFDHISEKENKWIVKLSDWYGNLLMKVLNHKILVFVVTIFLLITSVILSLSKGFSFFPEIDSTQMSMTMTMPKDTKKLEETRKMSDDIMEAVLEIDDIETVGAMLSGNNMSMLGLGSDDSFKSVSYYIECKKDKKHSNKEIVKLIEEKTKNFDCEIIVSASNMDMSAVMNSGVSVLIKGKDLDVLKDIAEQAGKKLEKVEGLVDVNNGLEDATPEYFLVVDKEKAAKYGLTVAQVFQRIQKVLEKSTSTTNLSTETQDYPIYVMDEKLKNYSLDDLKNIKIEGKEGEKQVDVKIGDIARIENTKALSAIHRKNQMRSIAISGQLKEGFSITKVSKEVKDVLEEMELPEGYTFEYNGENETIMESMEQVILMMVLALLFMYLIMVAQFQSFKNPFIVMFTIPLAFTGGFATLFITGKDVSIIAMIGMVMLSGIIVNNGIVFVDSINQLREEGLSIREAIMLTGKHRLRPIIMTALTTILGLSTMAMGLGMGADMAQPMALVTIGGLIYGTILTLFVVPCIYETLNKKKKMNKKLFKENSL